VTIIDTNTAQYLLAVVSRLDQGTLHPDANRAAVCPECYDDVSNHPGDHLVWRDRTAHTNVLLVGCEGYWVIDPNLVGITSAAWNDYRDPPKES